MELLTVKEISILLKAKTSTIYGWAEQGLIPCFKINGLLRFNEAEILTWIKNCAYNPLADKASGKERKKDGAL